MNKAHAQTGRSDEPDLPQLLSVGSGPAGRHIAYRLRPASAAGKGLPGLVWLCGFKSDMTSLKATYLDQWAARTGRALLRFDYSGHGVSGGVFEDGTIGRWLEEALAILDAASQGPQILIGSSMGGWLALLCARALAARGQSERLAGLILIAPAVDFTERLIWDRLPEDARRKLETDGAWLRPSLYSAEPYVITHNLITEGRNHLLLDTLIETHCPVHILQGMLDEDVPWRHALKIVERIAGDPVILTLIKDGAHRLSRDEDLEQLSAAITHIG